MYSHCDWFRHLKGRVQDASKRSSYNSPQGAILLSTCHMFLFLGLVAFQASAFTPPHTHILVLSRRQTLTPIISNTERAFAFVSHTLTDPLSSHTSAQVSSHSLSISPSHDTFSFAHYFLHFYSLAHFEHLFFPLVLGCGFCLLDVITTLGHYTV